jgi:hypothetical protein
VEERKIMMTNVLMISLVSVLLMLLADAARNQSGFRLLGADGIR